MINIIIGIEDPDECALAVFALRFAGYRVVKAASASELIAQATQAQPDLVLVETNFDGLEENALQQALDNSAEGIPILYLVNELPGDLAPRVFRHINYLRRPISPDTLTRKVNEVLKRG